MLNIISICLHGIVISLWRMGAINEQNEIHKKAQSYYHASIALSMAVWIGYWVDTSFITTLWLMPRNAVLIILAISVFEGVSEMEYRLLSLYKAMVYKCIRLFRTGRI